MKKHGEPKGVCACVFHAFDACSKWELQSIWCEFTVQQNKTIPSISVSAFETFCSFKNGHGFSFNLKVQKQATKKKFHQLGGFILTERTRWYLSDRLQLSLNGPRLALSQVTGQKGTSYGFPERTTCFSASSAFSSFKRVTVKTDKAGMFPVQSRLQDATGLRAKTRSVYL